MNGGGPTARVNFARRVGELAKKITGDGMGFVPDVITLQEVYDEHALAVADVLEKQTGYRFRVAQSFSSADLDGDPRNGTRAEGDSAILYNADTMIPLGKGQGDSPVAQEDVCVDDPAVVQDFDLDGEDDCALPKIKVHALAMLAEALVGPVDGGALSEPQSVQGLTIAAASVHFSPGGSFSSPATESRKKAQWSREVAQDLQSGFGGADTFAIGGDFNHRRCDELGAPPLEEKVTCTERAFWKDLRSLGFVDSVFATHNESDPELSGQYRAGNERGKRIDFLFTAGNTRRDAASHDVSCGEDDLGGNCKQRTSPGFYSDHRLNWTFLGPTPVVRAEPASL